MINLPISTYVINLRKRVDRKKSIQNEFAGRSEFALELIEPVVHENPKESLWRTIKYIIEYKVTNHDEFIIVCEDDHVFRENYSKDLLLECILQAHSSDCDLLSGGASCVKSTFPIASNLFWMEEFTGLQFTVIFKRSFQAIIDFQFSPNDDADIVLSSILRNKLIVFPFISVQKEFGYSDVTYKNNISARVGYSGRLDQAIPWDVEHRFVLSL